MEFTYTPGGDFPTGGGEQGPMFTPDSPPHGFDECTPKGEDGPDFDPGPAIMTAASDAFNAVIEGGGSYGDAMQAFGGAAAEAAGEMGITPQEFEEGMNAFKDGFNDAQTEGGDCGTCINAGFDAANEATSDEHDYHPPEDYPINEPGDFPAAGEGHIPAQPPVDMPEEMTHNWEEGAPADDHPCCNHEPGEPYGPGPEMPPPLAEGEAGGYTGGDDGGMIPEMDMPAEGEGGPQDGGDFTMAPPDPDGQMQPQPPSAAEEAMASQEAADVAAKVAEATAAGDNGVVQGDGMDGMHDHGPDDKGPDTSGGGDGMG